MKEPPTSVEWITIGLLGVFAIIVIMGCLLAPLDDDEDETPERLQF